MYLQVMRLGVFVAMGSDVVWCGGWQRLFGCSSKAFYISSSNYSVSSRMRWRGTSDGMKRSVFRDTAKVM